jgi:RHS repeat-associated protein
MPTWYVNEPYLNLWLYDAPIPYTPGFGPSAQLVMALCSRSQPSPLTQAYWYGASFGFSSIQWNSSWLSFIEFSSDGYSASVMLPGGGWNLNTFAANSTVSDVNYGNNIWLEKQGPNAGLYPNAVTNLVLHFPDGSLFNYGLVDPIAGLTGLFFMTSHTDASGASVTFSYDSNYYLTKVTAADGTYFNVTTRGGSSNPQYITGVTSSYGATASFRYDSVWDQALTNITDAAGISSWIIPDNVTFGAPLGLVTPYGTTIFGSNDEDNGTQSGVFQRIVQITNAIGQVEFYGMVNVYGGTDWASFSAAAVPTNTPLGTLDSDPNEMSERNTMYFNAQQFAPYVGTSLSSFNYSIFMNGRIRHWLATTGDLYSHFDTLSSEQAPSPDGSTAGQTTWYDYVGKPSGVNYEIGTQRLPSVIARVMPDGSTWYRYFDRLINGLPRMELEAWMDSGTVHTRSNVWVWAANNADLLSWTNANHVMVTSNQYNAFHQVVTNYDALGQITTNGYDATTHLITSSKNAAGLITLYSYSSGHLQSVADLPVNRTNRYTWNGDGTLATRTDPRNLTETYFWDSLHRLKGTSDYRGTTTNLYYVLSGTAYANSSGGTAIIDLTATRNRLGNWTSYVYDAARRKIAETNGIGVVTAYAYCPCGSVSSITNAWNTPVQEVTTLNFDNQSRLSFSTYADGYSVTNWYDSLSRVTVQGDGAANRWMFYNNVSQPTVRSNAYGAELTESYDNLGRPQYVTDANGVMITNTFDVLDRLVARGYPDGGVERFGYSAKGLIAYTNQINATNFYAYDELGRKTYETNANGEILKYTNSAAGDLLSLTDGKNQTTLWYYDTAGRVSSKYDQGGSLVLTYTYDPLDHLTNRWSAAMGYTSYSYDGVGNLTGVHYPHSPAQTYSYDSLNRLTNMVDPSGTTKYGYTAGNQVWTEIPPISNGTITNTYSNRLRTLMTLKQPSGVWTNKFVYDAAGRLTNVTSPAGVFSYTPGGASGGSRLTKKLLLPNTAYITNKFDGVARLTGTYLDNSANTVLDAAAYGYNLAGQRIAFTNAAGTYVQYYYDNIGQLKIANSSVSTENRGYFYDAAWNLNRQTNNGTVGTFSVDVKNQLTADPNSGTDTYDSNGNLTRRTVTGTETYGYDDENRLTNVVLGTTYNTVFAYDGLSRLRTRTDYTWTGTNWYPQAGISYLYDGNRVIQERGAVPLVSYTRGTDLSGSMEGAGGIGGLLARSYGYSSGNWSTHHFYHADGNGNITYLVDSSQAMAATYRYDPFGNTLSSNGTLAATNVYRFSSKEIHVNSGMYIYLYRFYDPSLQRWINRDPLEEDGGLNLYTFVDNNPLNQIDPFGYSSIPITVVEAIASGNVAQMQALLDLAGELSLSPAAQAALRAAIANAARAAALAAAAAGVCEMARHESGQRNYINDKAAEISKKSGDPICTVLQAMMDAAKQDNSKAGKALQQTIKQAMKAAGCRHHN